MSLHLMDDVTFNVYDFETRNVVISFCNRWGEIDYAECVQTA